MGGRPWEARDGGKYFVNVLFRYFPKTVKLAFCNFAQNEDDWEDTTDRNMRMFRSFTKKKIENKIMTEKNFRAVSKWADVIYIPGGDSEVLKKRIKNLGNLKILWEEKILAGSSAGADFFCTAYISLRRKTLDKGLGWVNVACIPHWRDNYEDYTKKDWDWAEKEALQTYPNLPLLCIPEGEFVEFSVK